MPRVAPTSVAAFLQWSFDVLHRTLPTAFEELCTRLDRHTVLLHIDRESFTVAFGNGAAVIHSPPTSTASATVSTTRETILSVIDAECTLQQAVLSDRLVVKAPLEELHRLLDALTLYVHCGVRCTQFPMILDSFRSYHHYRSATA